MGWLSGWRKRVALTVSPSGKVDSEQSNFPGWVHLSSSSGVSSKDVTPVFDEIGSDANRLKIAITTSDGTTQCYVEIENWDNAGEDANLWVKYPTLLSSGDTVIYLYYDSTQVDNSTYIGDTGSTPAQTVWDVNFVAVYHLAQDPSGGADAIKNSASDAHHGTTGGGMTTGDLIDAYIGKGLDFDGDDYVAIADHADLQSPTSLTMEVSFNTTTTGAIQKLLMKDKEGAPRYFYGMDIRTDNKLKCFYYNGTLFDANSPSTVTDGSQYDSVLRIAGTALEGFLDGVSIGTDTITGTQGAPTTELDIAASPDYGGGPAARAQFFTGQEDEVRISDTPRSDAWIKATSYSNKDNLITYGDEEKIISTSLGQLYALEGVTAIQTSLNQRYALLGVELFLTSLNQRYSLNGAPVASLDLVDVYYQLYVGTELIPFSSLQGRKRNQGQDSIYLVIPNGKAWIDAVTAQAGQDLVVKRGGKLRSDLSDVTPTEFIRATFETSSYAQGSKSSSITLMGFRDIDPPGTPKGVDLQDISYLAIGTDGKRRARARMDDTLNSGDQATFPDATFFTVGEISYTIGKSRFQMEVKEQ